MGRGARLTRARAVNNSLSEQNMDGIFDPAAYGVSDNPQYTFTVGPQNDGTYVTPTAALPYNQAVDVGSGSQVGNYAPQVFNLLGQGLSAFTTLYGQNQLLDYKRYEATQGGLFAQGQAAASLGQAQIAAVNSNKMLMILGIFAVIALAVHKG
jgi:hypothetical protein